MLLLSLYAKIPEASTAPGTLKIDETSTNTGKSHPFQGGFLV
jgi:hypothetical protein